MSETRHLHEGDRAGIIGEARDGLADDADVTALDGRVDQLEGKVDTEGTVSEAIDTAKTEASDDLAAHANAANPHSGSASVGALNAEVIARQQAVAAEQTARQAADQQLATDLATEVAARQDAVSQLAADASQAITAERTARWDLARQINRGPGPRVRPVDLP